MSGARCQDKSNRPRVLWCPKGNGGSSGKNGWGFPRKVEMLLRQDTFGRTVLHLFGGKASWGTRLDLDPQVKPDVLGSAWNPPFARGSFDVVILDPPYLGIDAGQKCSLFAAAGWIARQEVIWFSTQWISQPPGMRQIAAWLVRAGENTLVRCIQVFVPTRDFKPPRYVKHAPARKYTRWT